ncbi:MAG: hypothetical protein LBV71_06060 [Prevotella sp.]|jgi:hypothetical protein|nr:hypothetical protein [Prevotella sp.]
MLTIPKILDTPEFLDAPLGYKWDKNSAGYYSVDAENEKIVDALWQLNHKATYGLATALGEWIYWRSSKYINKETTLLALEAQWAGLVHYLYGVNWKFGNEYISTPVDGPFWAMMTCMQDCRESYMTGDYFINSKTDNLAILARHISPDKEFFDTWLNNILHTSSNLFPARYDRQEIFENMDDYEDKYYDSTDEPAIPRQFFWEPDYSFENEDNVKLINDFLSNLDYKNNTFLSSPRSLLKRNFKGTPYIRTPVNKINIIILKCAERFEW